MLSKDNIKTLSRSFALRVLLHGLHDSIGVRRHHDVRDALLHVSCQAIAIAFASNLLDPFTDNLSVSGPAVIFGLLVLYAAFRILATARRKQAVSA